MRIASVKVTKMLSFFFPRPWAQEGTSAAGIRLRAQRASALTISWRSSRSPVHKWSRDGNVGTVASAAHRWSSGSLAGDRFHLRQQVVAVHIVQAAQEQVVGAPSSWQERSGTV